MVKEENMYPCVEEWFKDNVSKKKHDLEVVLRAGIRYGPLSAQIDVLGMKYRVFEDEEPQERQLTDLFVAECKANPWSYEGYGQLLYYKTLFELFRHSKHWKCFNEDFYHGPRRYFKHHNRLPGWWEKYCLGKGKLVEWVSDKLKVHFFVALYRPKPMDDRDWDDVRNTVKNMLSVFEGARMSVGLLLINSDFSGCQQDTSVEESPLVLTSKVVPKKFFSADDAILIPHHKTWLYCNWFKKNGKATHCRTLSEKEEASPQNCRFCPSFRNF